jgi:hypothetical protein
MTGFKLRVPLSTSGKTTTREIQTETPPGNLATRRRAAGPMAEVLRGKSPGEMPFYQPTRFQLVIAREQRSESDLSFHQNCSPR